MKTFQCQCGNSVFFRNSRCASCGRLLGYAPGLHTMTALEPGADGCWQVPDSGRVRGAAFRLCANYADHDVCNWLIPADQPGHFCFACRLNRVTPNLSHPRHPALWYRLETAKRHMLYTLLDLGLPVIGRDQDPQQGLAFDFLSDRDTDSEFTEPLIGADPVSTGHLNGIITINLAEADEVARARMQAQMGENYRTLLGHFRHEIGHYYWSLLIERGGRIAEFRELFGDERADYAQSLQRHYHEGAPADWSGHAITAYATAHPWEDWAESWAHYMHMTDTLDTALQFQFVPPRPWRERLEEFDTMMHAWTRLATGMNAINRSMGLADAYPFVLQEGPARDKLAFIHEVIRAATGDGATMQAPRHRFA